MRFKQDELTNVKWLLGTTLITHYEDELIANEFVQYHFEESSRTNTDAICHGKIATINTATGQIEIFTSQSKFCNTHDTLPVQTQKGRRMNTAMVFAHTPKRGLSNLCRASRLSV